MKRTVICFLLVLLIGKVHAQHDVFTYVSASVNANKAPLALDNNSGTSWHLYPKDLKSDQFLMLTLQTPGNIEALQLEAEGISKQSLQKLLNVLLPMIR